MSPASVGILEMPVFSRSVTEETVSVAETTVPVIEETVPVAETTVPATEETISVAATLWHTSIGPLAPFAPTSLDDRGPPLMKTTPRDTRLIVGLALLAPVVFVIHVVEEAPTFVPWFNSLVEPDITEPLFLSVNGVAFLITVVLSGILATTRERVIAVVDLAWLGFLMFANALFHLTATVVHHRYSPGAITAACLYLPYFALLFAVVLRRFRVSWGVALSATVLGALPMAAHGYLIVFRGSRLF